MEPQSNQNNIQNSVATNSVASATAKDTFSAQVAKEDTLGTAAFENNAGVLAAHRRSNLFRLLWLLLILLLLLAIGFVIYAIVRNNSRAGEVSPANQFNTTALQQTNAASTSQINGQLTINGTANIVGDLNVGGNANIGGTLSATSLQGDGSGVTNIQPSNIAGVLGPAQLDPFIAYTNKNFQAFFGTNQIFRNASNSVGAFEVQNASSAPLLSVNTSTGLVGINTSAPNYNLDVAGSGRFSGQLLAGSQSTPNATILVAGPLFTGRSLQRTLTVQEEITNNNTFGRIYTGMANELLINPTVNPFINPGGNNNIFAGSYSAAQTAVGNPYNYQLVGGNMSALSHYGDGTVLIGVSQLNSITSGSSTPGSNILFAMGSASVPSLQNAGSISFYSGFTAVDPASPLFPAIGIPSFISGTGTIGLQVGLQVMQQHSASVPTNNVNILSEGVTSYNHFEGTTIMGTCALSPVNALVVGNPAVPCNAGALGVIYPGSVTGGPKLVVNLDKTTPYIDPNSSLQVTAAIPTDKPLVVVANSAQTADLTQWQSSTGTVLSSVASDGSMVIGSAGNPHAGVELSVTNTNNDTPATFTGASGTCTVNTLGGTLSCVSDERLKTHILSLTGGLDAVLALQGVTYNWKTNPDGSTVAGFIAQDVEKVLPNLVSKLSDGTLTLDKTGMIPYLVEAVKTQNGNITDINSKLAAQGIQVNSLSQELKDLAAKVDALQKDQADYKKSTDKRLDEIEKKLNIPPTPPNTPTPPESTTP